MHLVQLNHHDEVVTARVREHVLQVVPSLKTTYQLALEAINQEKSLKDYIEMEFETEDSIIEYDYETAFLEGKVFLPIHHPDPSRCYVTGTGLTHLGSAATRDEMHSDTLEQDSNQETDSMKMFRWGIESGGVPEGEIGVQPEWFYKGNGHTIVRSRDDLEIPSFATDGGEEPEVVGVYVIGQNKVPYRIGFVLGNDFSDHVMEKKNYLYLAHSKLRQCSLAPEIRLGELPRHVEGITTIYRDGKVIWKKKFVSGEDNMSHTITNLEQHHFKNDLFRNAGDVHLHFLGTSTLSFGDDIRLRENDQVEILSTQFGRALINTIKMGQNNKSVQVRKM